MWEQWLSVLQSNICILVEDKNPKPQKHLSLVSRRVTMVYSMQQENKMSLR